ncbi:unnamed protein product [Bursaphelenchus xylophilus]|uniref:Serpentine receptor class gamma n=1 Tax=Bursaphelenchus xylophilus TaxID=6326 RepID=A0A1I7S5V5_BURXY|nr:unnamed protein product [Bursaphelenchus xylophilus]CAG9125095.1 unnamed protein product [Bursaphelenchus xylophilus]
MIYVINKFRDHHFASVFYKILFVSGIMDALGYTNAILTGRLPNTDFFVEYLLVPLMTPTFALSPFKYLTNHAILCAQVTPFLLAVNRLTSLFTPLYYERIWKPYKIIIGTFYFVLPFGLCWFLLLNPAEFTYDDTKQWFTFVGFDYDHQFSVGYSTSNMTLYFTMFFAVTSFLVNVFNVGLLVKLRMERLINISREKSLMICTFVVFIAQTTVVMGEYFFVTKFFNIYVTLRFLLPPMFEIMFLFPCVISTLTVPPLRYAVLGREDIERIFTITMHQFLCAEFRVNDGSVQSKSDRYET